MRRNAVVVVLTVLAAGLASLGCDGSGGSSGADGGVSGGGGGGSFVPPPPTPLQPPTVAGPPSGPLPVTMTLTGVCRPSAAKPLELHLRGRGLDEPGLHVVASRGEQTFGVTITSRAATQLAVSVPPELSGAVITLRVFSSVVFVGTTVDLATVRPCLTAPSSFPLLFTQNSGGALRKVDSTGAPILPDPFVAGLGITTDAGGPAFDSQGNMYVPSFSTATIVKVTPAGVVSTFVTDALLTNIEMLAIDRAGTLYAGSFASHRVLKVSPAGVVTPFISSGLLSPCGMAFDDAENIYVTSYTGGYVSSFDAAGALRTSWGTNGKVTMTSPVGIAFDGQGDLFVTSINGNSVSKIRADGKTITTFASGLVQPVGLAIDVAGNLYCGGYGGTVYKVTPAGLVSSFVTGQVSVRALTLSPP